VVLGLQIFHLTSKNLRYEVRNRDAEFEFFLPKGCFATTFLREFLKEE